jgi:hypothetical protein
MTRLEKCELLKSKGYTYDPETGKIFGVYGKEITKKDKNGYIILNFDVKSHHFAWYSIYGNVDFYEIDHKDRNTSNNKINNLRIANRSQQNENKNSKGYSWDKTRNKFQSRIVVEGKKITLGYFNTEEEARHAYLEAKKKYHII